jgi:23S rRNA (guanine745-N1)-methyltransferase
VRACGEALLDEGRSWRCSRGHAFDRHRSGALNLLQPQDRRSKFPGDSKEAALARRRLAELGVSRVVHDAFLHAIRPRADRDLALLDVGCGEGAFLRSLHDVARLELHGVDLSSPAIELAAKASRGALFVVANADRALPYADASFDFICTIDARTNVDEFARVLKPDGLVLAAVPAADDLIELRERIYDAKIERPRVERVERELGSRFEIIERTVAREQRRLEPAVLRDLLTATYRGFRTSEQDAIARLEPLTVTLSHDVLAFRARST